MGAGFADAADCLSGLDKDARTQRRKLLTATILDQVRQIASDIFSVPVGSVGADSSADTIEAWNSMQHLNLVLALEEKFDVHFSPEEIEEMRSLGTIAAMLEVKLHRN